MARSQRTTKKPIQNLNPYRLTVHQAAAKTASGPMRRKRRGGNGGGNGRHKQEQKLKQYVEWTPPASLNPTRTSLETFHPAVLRSNSLDDLQRSPGVYNSARK